MIKKPTIIVGNGPVGRPGLGEYIDGFPRVVRFNTFQTKGFEADVGNRVTDWMFCAGKLSMRLGQWTARKLLRNTQNGLERTHVRVSARAITETHLDLWKIMGVRKASQYFIIPAKQAPAWVPRGQIIWPDKNTNWRVHKRIGAMMTTGIIAIMIAMKHFAEGPVEIVCFGPRDSFQNRHYFNAEHRHADPDSADFATSEWPHQWHREREVINEWEELGLVKRVDV